MTPSRLLLAVCVALAIACSSCGGYSGNSSNCFINTLNISPPSGVADHNLAAPGNSQQFSAFVGQASSSGCTYMQSNLTNVMWSVSDTANASIGNTMTGNPQTDNFGLATCLHFAATPITVTATLPAGSNSGHTATGTATLSCK